LAYFAAQKRSGAADYIQALLVSSGTEKWLADGRAGRIRQSIACSTWEEQYGMRNRCVPSEDYVVEHLDDGAGILAIDETSFPRGEESVGVGDNTAV